MTDRVIYSQDFFSFKLHKGRFQKKGRNFPHLSGVGGFEKVIFRNKKTKKQGLKLPKIA